MSEKAAFEVLMPDGHAYRVYESGEIEGFGPGAIVINRIPAMMRAAVVRYVADKADDQILAAYWRVKA